MLRFLAPVLAALLAFALPTFAQDVPAPAEEPAPVETPNEQSEETTESAPAPLTDGVQVSILGYHDFSASRNVTQMLIRTDKFREQMQALKDNNLPVISMADFLEWKAGRKALPQNCVMITIDDGWLSVYTDAYPILKEFGYPFTIFLYTAYLDGGGRALKTPMVKEMMENGATVGSHSHSHPFPSAIRRHQGRGKEHFDMYLRAEMLEPAKRLRDIFGTAVDTYAYPGGFYVEEMFPIGKESDYKMMFTVVPGKVRIDSDNNLLNRYIIFGDSDGRFEDAIRFLGRSGSDALEAAASVQLPFPVAPAAGARIAERRPNIIADLKNLTNIDPESITLQVGGFGTVPHVWDERSRRVSWKVSRPLRLETCDVSLRYKLRGSNAYEPTVRWTFGIDLESAYAPQLQ